MEVAACLEKGEKPEKPKKFWHPFRTKKLYLSEHQNHIASRQGRLDHDENVIISNQTHALHEKRGLVFAIKDEEALKQGRVLWFEYPDYHKRPLDELQFLKYHRWLKSKNYKVEIELYDNYLKFAENFEAVAYTLEEMQELEDTPRDVQITEKLLKHLPVRLEVTDLEAAKRDLLDMKTYFDQNKLSPDDMFRYTETVRILQERWDAQEQERLRTLASYEDKSKPAVEITNSMIIDDPSSSPEEIAEARKNLKSNADKDKIDRQVEDLTQDMMFSDAEQQKQRDTKRIEDDKATKAQKAEDEKVQASIKAKAEEKAETKKLDVENWGDNLDEDIDIFATPSTDKPKSKPKAKAVTVEPEVDDFGMSAPKAKEKKTSGKVTSALAQPVLLDPESFEVKKAVTSEGVNMLEPLDLAPNTNSTDLEDLWDSAEL